MPVSEMSAPRLSIVIPSRSGLEMPLLVRLLADQLPSQSVQDYEVHVVIGDNRQGRAINQGARQARGTFLATMDDDIELGDEKVLERILGTLEGDPTVGIAGASCPVPPDSSPFQRAALRQIPRRYFPVVPRITDSDMVQHGCLALRRDLFWRIGGEDEDLVRGLDPIIRTKVRDLGLRVVIVPRTWFYHRPPRTAADLLGMYFRNGRGSAFAVRHFPDRVLELGTGFEGGDFRTRRTLPSRVLRRILRGGGALIGGRWVRLATDIAYTAGFVREYLVGSESPRKESRQIRKETTLGSRITLWRSYPAP